MDPRLVSLSDVRARMRENKLKGHELALPGGYVMVVLERGGRLFGPFNQDSGESVFWISRMLKEPMRFANAVKDGEWNLGGERVWIAPEVQFCVRDRSDMGGTWFVPQAMDPARYSLKVRDDSVELVTTMSLQAYNTASGKKFLRLQRLVRPAAHPLAGHGRFQSLCEGVLYTGYSHEVSLTERLNDGTRCEAWTLIQIEAGGEMIVPVNAHPEYESFFDPVPKSAFKAEDAALRFKITGDRRYKVGFKAASLVGRLGYYRKLGSGRAGLVVRNYFNNPSCPYLEEPAGKAEARGMSAFVYNDDGALGGFGELECNGQTIGGDTGRRAASDTFVTWCFEGPAKRLKDIALMLLGNVNVG